MKTLVTSVLVTISDDCGITKGQDWKGPQNPVGQLKNREVLSGHKPTSASLCWSSLQKQMELTLLAYGELKV